MNNRIASNNVTISPQYASGTTPPDNLRGEKTAQGISVVPPEQVSPLLALPNELLVEIANYLPFVDFNRLALTSRRLTTLFNTEERLKKLSNEYYDSASDAYRKIIQNRSKESFRYKVHQSEMIETLKTFKISLEMHPRNEFYEIEGQVLDLIQTVNNAFAANSNLEEIADRAYI